MDLCQDKKFIDLNKDISFFNTTKGGGGIIDSDKNIWMREEGKKGEGGYGVVLFFKSHNKSFCDLAVKFIKDRYEAANEILTMTLFNRFKCKNFMKCGGLEDGDTFIAVMEKMDADLSSLDYKKVDNPEKFFMDFIKFIISSYRCAMKRDMYYTDIKPENIGLKICQDGYRFCFLDYGSFAYIDSQYFMASFWINLEGAEGSYFPIDTVVIFGTIMTFLNIKMIMVNQKGVVEFSKKLSYLLNKKKYPKTSLLSKKYYKEIVSTYYKYFKGEDKFVEILMDCLERLTEENYSVSSFLEMIEYHA